MSSSPYRKLSFWHDSMPPEETFAPRSPLPGSRDVDVAIVGAGYTGLWTAYYLAAAAPDLRIAVIEREIAGFGASGRNGGWCSAIFPPSLAKLARLYDRDAAIRMRKAMYATVDAVGAAVAAEGIDCHWSKGGTIIAARTPVQLDTIRADVALAREFGFGPEDLALLDAAEAKSRLHVTDTLGASYTPHCAAIHPARLVRRLAEAVEKRGVEIFECTPVTSIAARLVETPHGRVRASYVIRATEGFTPQLPGQRRSVVPIYSLMLATEPLPASFWEVTGLRRRETFADRRHLIVYGQRTADDRLAFGGRGAPYHFGSKVRREFDREPSVFEGLRQVLADFFPALRDVAITHTWGGPLGISRDWVPSAGLDPGTGLGWAGGYVGDGVGISNLAGRTLADLVLGADSDLVHLPWVGHRSPPWAPEPLRWLGANVGLRMMSAADGEEARTGAPSRRAALFTRFMGN